MKIVCIVILRQVLVSIGFIYLVTVNERYLTYIRASFIYNFVVLMMIDIVSSYALDTKN